MLVLAFLHAGSLQAYYCAYVCTADPLEQTYPEQNMCVLYAAIPPGLLGLPYAIYPTYLQNLWLSVTFALMEARNHLHIKEHLTDDMAFGTIPGVATGLEAFNNPEWKYGKLRSRSLSKWGIDDIQIKLGDNWFFDCGNSHFGAFFWIL